MTALPVYFANALSVLWIFSVPYSNERPVPLTISPEAIYSLFLGKVHNFLSYTLEFFFSISLCILTLGNMVHEIDSVTVHPGPIATSLILLCFSKLLALVTVSKLFVMDINERDEIDSLTWRTTQTSILKIVT